MGISVHPALKRGISFAADVGLCSGVGYLVSRNLTTIQPLHGIIFSATSVVIAALVEQITKPIFFEKGKSFAIQLLGHCFTICFATLFSGAICLSFGLPVGFLDGTILTGPILVTTLAVSILSEMFFQSRQNRLRLSGYKSGAGF